MIRPPAICPHSSNLDCFLYELHCQEIRKISEDLKKNQLTNFCDGVTSDRHMTTLMSRDHVNVQTKIRLVFDYHVI